MSSQTTKTLNSFPEDKINLRLMALNLIDMHEINVLDCFHGYGFLWGEIQRRTEKKINLIGIEIDKKKKSSFNVVYGDNKKIIPSIDLDKFDIIDIDSFGDAFSLIKTVHERIKPGAIVLYTHITVSMGVMGKDLINFVFGWDIYKKCKALFRSKFMQIFEAGLYKLGIREVIQMNKNHKIYGFFKK